MSPVKNQYERFPYPPIPVIALPDRDQGMGLKYEIGRSLSSKLTPTSFINSKGLKILVAGAGTLEPLVVAQAHPYAQEIVAVDLSQTALSKLKHRILLAKLTRFPWRLPPIRLICADLLDWLKSSASFDYIIASNVIHHVPNPAQLLKLFSDRLTNQGLLRIVTYPKSSRLWMRQTSRWLQLHGIDPTLQPLVSKTQKVIELLPPTHPVRLCFESHPEIKTPTGIVDAFLHECESPLSPLEWKKASAEASLTCIGETQTQMSQSHFLSEIEPALSNLPFWEKLQLLDDLLEVCTNPILWFLKSDRTFSVAPHPTTEEPSLFIKQQNQPQPLLNHLFDLPSPLFWELKQNLLRMEWLLQNTSTSAQSLIEKFKIQVGPRVHPQNSNCLLEGLALSDYDFSTVKSALHPWCSQDWENLNQKFGSKLRLFSPQYPEKIPGDCLTLQAQWLEIYLGTHQASIPVELISEKI